MYNKKKDKKRIKKCRKYSFKSYNVDNLFLQALPERIVPSYVNKIDETLVSPSFDAVDEGIVLYSDGKKQEELEDILDGNFFLAETYQIELKKKSWRKGHFRIQKKSLDSVTRNLRPIKYGSLALTASLGADIGISYYMLSKYPMYFREGNEAVLNSMNFLQGFGVDCPTSLLLGGILDLGFRLAVLGSFSLLKQNNVVTDGSNTYFYRKPYQGKLVSALYAFNCAVHIYFAARNAYLLHLFGSLGA